MIDDNLSRHTWKTQEYIEMSVYRILQTLGMDPTDGRNYEYFRRDMDKAFHLSIETDRFRHPKTGLRSHIKYLTLPIRDFSEHSCAFRTYTP